LKEGPQLQLPMQPERPMTFGRGSGVGVPTFEEIGRVTCGDALAIARRTVPRGKCLRCMADAWLGRLC
jgi:hypothetical protein